MLEASGDPAAPTKSRRARAAAVSATRSPPATASPRSTSSAVAGARSSATSTRAASTTSWPASRPRSSTSGSTRTGSCTSTRSCSPASSRPSAAAATARASPICSSPGRRSSSRSSRTRLKTKGARLSMELTIAGRYMVYAPTGEGVGVSRRLEDKERDRLRKEAKQLDLGGGGAIIRTAAHGATRADFERELQYLFKLNDVLEQRVEGHAGARARLPGGGPVGPRRPRHLLRALRARDRRRRGPPPPRVVLHAHRAGAGRPRRALRRRGGPAVRGLRRRPGDQRDARAPRGPARRRLPDHRLRRGADGDRRQHRLVHRQGQVGPARGHDHQDQPRGRRGGRAPAAAARHRRHHRHRLHRHGPLAQPRGRAEGPAQGARRGPHEDLRGRDLAARPGRDDAPERHRRRARDHDQAVPGVHGEGVVKSEETIAIEFARHLRHMVIEAGEAGPRPTCCGSTRASPPGSSPTARASCTRSSRRPAGTSTSRAPTACRWTTSR